MDLLFPSSQDQLSHRDVDEGGCSHSWCRGVGFEQCEVCQAVWIITLIIHPPRQLAIAIATRNSGEMWSVVSGHIVCSVVWMCVVWMCVVWMLRCDVLMAVV